MNLGLKTRQEILTASLFVESWISVFLASLVGIKDLKNSKTLGNKNGCLSFNQKVEFLIEIGALSNGKDVRSKFQTFMEIRNQFMHNVTASTYEKCFASMGGKDKYLLKTYPQAENLSREEQLSNATGLLIDDVSQLSVSLIEIIKNKNRAEIELEIAKKSQQAFVEAIRHVKLSLNDYYEKEISGNPNFTNKKLEGFGTVISNVLYEIWREKFDKFNSTNDKATSKENVEKLPE